MGLPSTDRSAERGYNAVFVERVKGLERTEPIEGVRDAPLNTCA
jgi:hypothetical protein